MDASNEWGGQRLEATLKTAPFEGHMRGAASRMAESQVVTGATGMARLTAGLMDGVTDCQSEPRPVFDQ